MTNELIFLKKSKIYTTGAFISPLQVTDSNGNARWIWSVVEFEDDTYYGGEICNPVANAETCEKLLREDVENDEIIN